MSIKTTFDAAYQVGAYNAINTCLRLKPEERITIITDRGAEEIAASMVSEVQKRGSEFGVFVIEDFDNRPLQYMPEKILRDLERSDVSVYAASAEPGELKVRMEMMDIINRRRIRHGHMVNITHEIMVQGMRADFRKIDKLSARLLEKARRAKRITASTPAGTDITVDFSPALKWIKTSGIISRDKWGNLPGGEIFTSPKDINGRFVVDGVVGNYLCKKYGDLKKTPLAIDIKQSRIAKITCDNPNLLLEFTEYTEKDENSNRVGEFAIGTNLMAKQIIGNILQDEKMPGIHIAFGHPYSEHTGADWTSTTHIDCVGRDFDIWMDEKKVMEQGRFLLNGNGH